MLIKYMYSIRCKLAVKSELLNLGIQYKSINLGEVILQNSVSDVQYKNLNSALYKIGFEIIDEENSKEIREVKQVIIEMVHYAQNFSKAKSSDYISERMNKNYASLSKNFKEYTGVTIENYIIKHKIECVKELMIYDKKSISEIAFEMNYSSEAHLSGQFKKVTGMTPTDFKKTMCFRNSSTSAPKMLM